MELVLPNNCVEIEEEMMYLDGGLYLNNWQVRSILLIKLLTVLSIIVSLLLCVISFYIQDLQRYLLGILVYSMMLQMLNITVTLFLEHNANQFVRTNLQNEMNKDKYINIYIYAQEYNEILYLCIWFLLSLIAYFIIK